MKAEKLILSDQMRWIFPLKSVAALASEGADRIRKHLRDEILNPKAQTGFSPCDVAFARKDEHHLRKVLVLDPIACFYIFDFVVQHRSYFQTTRSGKRRRFGHAFKNATPVDAFKQYHAFRREKYKRLANHDFFVQADVFNCFNSFYHHDVTSYLSDNTSTEAGQGIGQFLREINAGTSISCFPQGLYPAKVLGNAYLGFIEQSRRMRAQESVRFLDDIVLFCDSDEEARDALLDLQYILASRHLSLNDSKTIIGDRSSTFKEVGLDEIRRSLVEKREELKGGYDDHNEDDEEQALLEEDEREYLVALLQSPNLAQEDVELALTLLRNELDAFDLVVEPVIEKAPHLLRGLHRFIATSGPEDGGQVWDAIANRLKKKRIPEHDLFWYARTLVDYYEIDQDVADLLLELYYHPEATSVVKAAILEDNCLDHGLDDLKIQELRSGSNLLIVSAAMHGLSGLEKGKRNHQFKYARRNGANVAVLADIASMR